MGKRDRDHLDTGESNQPPRTASLRITQRVALLVQLHSLRGRDVSASYVVRTYGMTHPPRFVNGCNLTIQDEHHLWHHVTDISKDAAGREEEPPRAECELTPLGSAARRQGRHRLKEEINRAESHLRCEARWQHFVESRILKAPTSQPQRFVECLDLAADLRRGLAQAQLAVDAGNSLLKLNLPYFRISLESESI